MVKKLGFVIPVLNQMQLALETLESIRTRHQWQIYLERNYLENKGVAAAWNIGTRRAIEDGCDIIFILNDDIVISPSAIDHMVNIWGRASDLGVLTGTDHRNSHSPAEVFNMDFPEYEGGLLDAPDFAFFSITPFTYSYIGAFDENFKPAYFEDNDYVYRTLLAGLRPLRSQNAAFYHYGSRTQNHGAPVVPSSQFVKNRSLYVEKWGGLPGQEGFKHPFNDPNKNWREI